jgi:phosphopantothenoylcysteine decarboxylase/phosphopantothenate--cysteine ligase
VMWSNPATQANVATLRQRGIRILGPGVGDQACGETGAGRMLEPLEIAEVLSAPATPIAAQVLAGLKVVVTAGPTRECIDPVRFVSNRSSGKMGYAVADAASHAGAQVTLISGPVSLCAPRGLKRVEVESAEQMLDAVRSCIEAADIFIAAAAVSDYRAENIACEKIKKTSDTMALQLTRTPDILATIGALANRPFLVGFAAETTDVERHALIKLESKHLDMIAANRVGKDLAFDKDDNALTVLWAGGRRELALASKTELARSLIELIAERLRAKKSATAALSSARTVSSVG